MDLFKSCGLWLLVVLLAAATSYVAYLAYQTNDRAPEGCACSSGECYPPDALTCASMGYGPPSCDCSQCDALQNCPAVNCEDCCGCDACKDVWAQTYSTSSGCDGCCGILSCSGCTCSCALPTNEQAGFCYTNYNINGNTKVWNTDNFLSWGNSSKNYYSSEDGLNPSCSSGSLNNTQCNILSNDISAECVSMFCFNDINFDDQYKSSKEKPVAKSVACAEMANVLEGGTCTASLGDTENRPFISNYASGVVQRSVGATKDGKPCDPKDSDCYKLKHYDDTPVNFCCTFPNDN